jgi:hypothetical protein
MGTLMPIVVVKVSSIVMTLLMIGVVGVVIVVDRMLAQAASVGASAVE